MTTTNPATTARIEAIRDAAEARRLLGQAATHRLLDDGRHEVSIFDRAAGRLLVGIGATVAQAVANIREEPDA